MTKADRMNGPTRAAAPVADADTRLVDVGGGGALPCRAVAAACPRSSWRRAWGQKATRGFLFNAM